MRCKCLGDYQDADKIRIEKLMQRLYAVLEDAKSELSLMTRDRHPARLIATDASYAVIHAMSELEQVWKSPWWAAESRS